MNKTKVTKPLNLSEFSDWALVPKGDRDTVKAEVAEFVIDSILDALGDATSPVLDAGKFDPLSSKYAKFKKGFSSSGTANMELTGEMLDALTWKNLGGNSLEVGWLDAEQAGKAHGHTTGYKHLPERKLMPNAKEHFEDDIETGIGEIIASFAEEPDDQDDQTSDPITPQISAAAETFGDGIFAGLFGG